MESDQKDISNKMQVVSWHTPTPYEVWSKKVDVVAEFVDGKLPLAAWMVNWACCGRPRQYVPLKKNGHVSVWSRSVYWPPFVPKPICVSFEMWEHYLLLGVEHECIEGYEKLPWSIKQDY